MVRIPAETLVRAIRYHHLLHDHRDIAPAGIRPEPHLAFSREKSGCQARRVALSFRAHSQCELVFCLFLGIKSVFFISMVMTPTAHRHYRCYLPVAEIRGACGSLPRPIPYNFDHRHVCQRDDIRDEPATSDPGFCSLNDPVEIRVFPTFSGDGRMLIPCVFRSSGHHNYISAT